MSRTTNTLLLTHTNHVTGVRLQVRCLLIWGSEGGSGCSPLEGILGELARKRRVFTHSPSTFWTLASQPLNRSLAPFSEWKPPFVVADVFLPMPKTCSACTETLPQGSYVSCWQASSYMHCRCSPTS
jgi:hypothetical protein